jgi:hypothetical protein
VVQLFSLGGYTFMLKLADTDRKKWAELKRCWLAFAILIVLIVSPDYVGSWFGRVWELAAAALAIPVWLVIRPWRIGLLSVETRESMKGWTVGLFVVLLLFHIFLFILWHEHHAA